MLVLRPADVEETTQAWKLAMENTATPTAFDFSRRILQIFLQVQTILKQQKVLIS